MYLSRITPATNRAIDHRFIMAAFPDTNEPNPRAHFGVLYRAEPNGSVLVQSRIEPNWDDILPKSNFQVRPFEISLEPDGLYRCRTAIAPISRRDKKEQLIDPIDWLKRRDFGFVLEEVIEVSKSKRFEHSRNSAIPVDIATIDAVIQISDNQKAEDSIRNGLGRKKAYGCGMISLVPRVE